MSHSTEVPSPDPASSCTKPRVVAILEYDHPNFSGAAIQAHRILSRLTQAGHAVDVLTMADQAASALGGQTRSLDGVRVHYLPVARNRDWSSCRRFSPLYRLLETTNRHVRAYSFHRGIRQFLRDQPPMPTIVQWYVVSEFTHSVMRATRQMPVRHMIQISLIGADDPSSFQRTWLGISTRAKLASFRAATSVICLSNALLASCRRVGLSDRHLKRIPNGVDLTNFVSRFAEDNRSAKELLGLSATRRYLIFVGSAIHRKGIDVLIPAFIRFAPTQSDVDLLIVGPHDFSDRTRHDPSRAELVQHLQAELQQAGLTDRVHWIGQVENVSDYLRASEAFVFPTRREGLPNAMAEAMACGLPVIASRLEGITTDLVNEGIEGRLVVGHNPTDYAQTLITLFQAPEQLEAMGRAARERIERDFCLKKIVLDYQRLYAGDITAPQDVE